jgi:uncharacterized protein
MFRKLMYLIVGSVVMALIVWMVVMNLKQNSGGVNIFDAVENNDPKNITLFAKSGGDLNVKNFKGYTPLWIALSEKKKASYEALLKNGADPNVIMSRKRVVTHWAALNNEDSRWLKLALENGADPNLINVGNGRTSDGTPLEYAITSSNIRENPVAAENVKLLVEHGAKINNPERNFTHPLSLAAGQNDFKIVLYLLEQGADYNRSEYGGQKFLSVIRYAIGMKEDFLIKERRDDLDAVIKWMEAHNIDITEE